MCSFGYHPTTGQYTVVHIPRRCMAWIRRRAAVVAGGAGARAGGNLRRQLRHRQRGRVDVLARRGRQAGDGAGPRRRAHHVLRRAAGRAAAGVAAVGSGERHDCQLTSVHARLGVVDAARLPTVTTDAWVLEEASGGGGAAARPPSWSLRFTVAELRDVNRGLWITAPHFTHGEYVLSGSWDRKLLCRRKVGWATCRRRAAATAAARAGGCCGQWRGRSSS
ncbi:hypothetical protein ACP4OV_017886 [Aristida adscensionis]